MRHLLWGIPLIIALAMILWIAQFGDAMADHRGMFAFLMVVLSCTMGILMLLEDKSFAKASQPHHPGDADPYFDKPQSLRKPKPVEYRIYRKHVARDKAGEHSGGHHA